MEIWKKYYIKKIIKTVKEKYLENLLFLDDETFNFISKKKKIGKKMLLLSLARILLKGCGGNFFYNFILNSFFFKNKFLVFYNIYLKFSPTNSNLQIVESNGNSVIFFSAGCLKLKGKQKIARKLVLSKFFIMLKLLKNLFFTDNFPVALHLRNVGSYKFKIIKELKSIFFIKIIKIFELESFNGCRGKKIRRKKMRRKKERWLSWFKAPDCKSVELFSS